MNGIRLPSTKTFTAIGHVIAQVFHVEDEYVENMCAIFDEAARVLKRTGTCFVNIGDTYYGGGEWLLLAGLLGLQYAATGRDHAAGSELAWIAAHATADGLLPEQVDDHLLAPDRCAEWQERWGPVATPLLWSHAMFLSLAVRLGVAAVGGASVL